MQVVLATHNAHKVVEFQSILGAALPELEIVAYDGPEPIEDGTSFAENALIKARAAAAHTGLPALADDSGICVDVLGGAPGIFSARWAGHGKGAQANLDLLLDQLADMAVEHRSARFVCHIAIVVPQTGFEQVVEGWWPGSIAIAPRGHGGHGYDPIFMPEGHDVTAAELTPAEKNAISHRARAFEAAIPVLRMSVIPN
ncbi:MAG: RdgB/HAM1 family non-canonical purine NTP pyrophosphatase [Herbiconiux sp.]|uniref:RdgB/HAM1 family non-canonical purine NTP pyrophosphatase n=1 Tax=Herbiconiux sp. TaxID=1871186 RepID=UPI00121C47FF|nr:RdgB/HAM1 family non-canonical purine NTP pyrophosphatase [Herbiconiux sp.]TAJ49798.1 MAG: RdgB/HAM1 family non-canonical purine NTP pyrophosphatase [Herbiconiux sp.]